MLMSEFTARGGTKKIKGDGTDREEQRGTESFLIKVSIQRRQTS